MSTCGCAMRSWLAVGGGGTVETPAYSPAARGQRFSKRLKRLPAPRSASMHVVVAPTRPCVSGLPEPSVKHALLPWLPHQTLLSIPLTDVEVAFRIIDRGERCGQCNCGQCTCRQCSQPRSQGLANGPAVRQVFLDCALDNALHALRCGRLHRHMGRYPALHSPDVRLTPLPMQTAAAPCAATSLRCCWMPCTRRHRGPVCRCARVPPRLSELRGVLCAAVSVYTQRGYEGAHARQGLLKCLHNLWMRRRAAERRQSGWTAWADAWGDANTCA